MDFGSCIGVFEKIPYKDLKFLTIKDNSGRMSMSNVIDWLRPYTSKYVLVRGCHYGYHFHCLIVHNGKTIRPKKGIHVDIKDVGVKQNVLVYPPTKKEVVEEFNCNVDEMYQYVYFQLIDMGYPNTDVLDKHISVVLELKKRFYLPECLENYVNCSRLSARLSRNRKNCEIVKIINYLEKNYMENDENDRLSKYLTYYCKM